MFTHTHNVIEKVPPLALGIFYNKRSCSCVTVQTENGGVKPNAGGVNFDKLH